MSPLWRGFAGLVAVFFLAYYVTNWDKQIEEEKILISSDPISVATSTFEKEEFVFYQTWRHRYDEDGHQIGYWFVPGEKQIPETILKEYPDRKNLENTDGLEITQEHERNNRKSRLWAIAYNIHLSELLDHLKSDQ